MKPFIKKFLFVMLLLVVSTIAVLAQNLDSLVTVIINPPKTGNFATVSEAFLSIQTYIGGVLVFVSVYLAQWIPGLANVLSYIKPYFRAITIGIAVLWTLISFGKLGDSQAGFSFILSNVIFIVLSILKVLPSTPAQELFEARKDLNNLPI